MANDNGVVRPYSQEHILNQSFDRDLQQLMVESVGFDGVNLQRQLADNMARKVTEDGTTSYVACAAPGSLQSDAVWQAFKIDESSGLVITFADGNSNFDNVATDLSALSYS